MPKKRDEFANFQKAIKKVLTVSKKESDEQLAKMQAANAAKREERRPKG